MCKRYKVKKLKVVEKVKSRGKGKDKGEHKMKVKGLREAFDSIALLSIPNHKKANARTQ